MADPTRDEVAITEAEAQQLMARIQLTTPYSAAGIAEVQGYNSPIEAARLASLPRSDAQFVFSQEKNGVVKDGN